MSEQDDLVADVLGEAVMLGETPTEQELALGDAVAAHLADRRLQVEDEP